MKQTRPTYEDAQIMRRVYRSSVMRNSILVSMLRNDEADYRLMRWHLEHAKFERPAIRVLWREIQTLKEALKVINRSNVLHQRGV